jgi:hypothetical protein
MQQTEGEGPRGAVPWGRVLATTGAQSLRTRTSCVAELRVWGLTKRTTVRGTSTSDSVLLWTLRTFKHLQAHLYIPNDYPHIARACS